MHVTYCCRCGRIFDRGERYQRIYVRGRLLPVCRDQQSCEERAPQRTRRKRS